MLHRQSSLVVIIGQNECRLTLEYAHQFMREGVFVQFAGLAVYSDVGKSADAINPSQRALKVCMHCLGRLTNTSYDASYVSNHGPLW